MTTAINHIAISSSRLIRAGMDDPAANVAATLLTCRKVCEAQHAGIIQELSRHGARERAVTGGRLRRGHPIRPLKETCTGGDRRQSLLPTRYWAQARRLGPAQR